MLTNHNKAR